MVRLKAFHLGIAVVRKIASSVLPGCLLVTPPNFHEGMIDQSTKLLRNDYCVHEKDVPADVKKPYDSSRVEDVSQKFPNTTNSCQFLFMQYIFTTLRDLLCECDRYIHHLHDVAKLAILNVSFERLLNVHPQNIQTTEKHRKAQRTE